MANYRIINSQGKFYPQWKAPKRWWRRKEKWCSFTSWESDYEAPLSFSDIEGAMGVINREKEIDALRAIPSKVVWSD